MRIQPFNGFHSYDLEYGDTGSAAFFLDPPGGGNTFSNGQVPPTDFPRLTLGGAVGFPKGKAILGLAFPIAYDSSGANPNIVRVVGTARCAYPRRRHR